MGPVNIVNTELILFSHFRIVIPPLYVWLLRSCIAASGVDYINAACYNNLGHNFLQLTSSFLNANKIPFIVVCIYCNISYFSFF